MKRNKFPKPNILALAACALWLSGAVALFVTLNGENLYHRAFLAIAVLTFPIFLVTLITNINKCVYYLKYKRAMRKGTDDICEVVNIQPRYPHKNHWNNAYALTFCFRESGKPKFYKTKFLFTEDECNYLKLLNGIKCRHLNGFLAITEPFPESVYETENGKNTKFRRVFVTIWKSIVFIGFLLLFTGIALTVILNTSLYLIIGILCLSVPNAVCAMIFAICFLREQIKKKSER